MWRGYFLERYYSVELLISLAMTEVGMPMRCIWAGGVLHWCGFPRLWFIDLGCWNYMNSLLVVVWVLCVLWHNYWLFGKSLTSMSYRELHAPRVMPMILRL